VWVAGAGEVEGTGIGEPGRVSVRAGQAEQDRVACWYAHAPDAEVLGGEAPDRVLIRVGEADQFLDGGPGQWFPGRQPGHQLLGGQQREDAVADQVDRVLIACPQDQEGQGDEFILAELVLIVSRRDHCR